MARGRVGVERGESRVLRDSSPGCLEQTQLEVGRQALPGHKQDLSSHSFTPLGRTHVWQDESWRLLEQGTFSLASAQPSCRGSGQGPYEEQGHGAHKCCGAVKLVRMHSPAVLRWVWFPPSQSMTFRIISYLLFLCSLWQVDYCGFSPCVQMGWRGPAPMECSLAGVPPSTAGS